MWAQRIAPWALVALALLPALLMLGFAAPAACDELPDAFSRGVTTEHSDTLWVVASHCETTSRATGTSASATVINWSGLVGATALLVGAWAAGAGAAGLIGSRPAVTVIGAAAAAGVVALAAFFL